MIIRDTPVWFMGLWWKIVMLKIWYQQTHPCSSFSVIIRPESMGQEVITTFWDNQTDSGEITFHYTISSVHLFIGLYSFFTSFFFLMKLCHTSNIFVLCYHICFTSLLVLSSRFFWQQCFRTYAKGHELALLVLLITMKFVYFWFIILWYTICITN